MSLLFNDELRMFRESVRQFAAKEYSFERRNALLNDAAAQQSLWKEMVNLGWTALGVPEELGGIGGVPELAVVAEELGRCLFVGPFLSSTVLGGQLLAAAGATGRDVLEEVIAGQSMVAVAYSEEGSRGAFDQIVTRAQRVNDHFVLEGRKTLVFGANNANRLVVSALMTDRDEIERIALFMIDTAHEGVEIIKTRLLDGSDAADVVLRCVSVGEQAILMEDGAAELGKALDMAILVCCAEAVGIMSRATESCVEYATIRKQFGKAIAEFQAIQHKIADMVIETEVVKAALCAALSSYEHEDARFRRKALATAKAMCGVLGRWVCGQAVQLHGGMGMAEEHIVGHFFRRINVIEASFGNGFYHLSELKRMLRGEIISRT